MTEMERAYPLYDELNDHLYSAPVAISRTTLATKTMKRGSWAALSVIPGAISVEPSAAAGGCCSSKGSLLASSSDIVFVNSM